MLQHLWYLVNSLYSTSSCSSPRYITRSGPIALVQEYKSISM